MRSPRPGRAPLVIAESNRTGSHSAVQATGAAAKATGDLHQVVPLFEQACLATVPIQTLSAGKDTCQRSPPSRRPEPERKAAVLHAQDAGAVTRTAMAQSSWKPYNGPSAKTGLGADDEPDYPREPGHLVLARVLIAEDRPGTVDAGGGQYEPGHRRSRWSSSTPSKARHAHPGQARRGQPHPGRRPGTGTGPDPLSAPGPSPSPGGAFVPPADRGRFHLSCPLSSDSAAAKTARYRIGTTTPQSSASCSTERSRY